MALILNIETTTTNCSVSISDNGEVVGLKEDYSSGYSHAERLHVYIEELLKEQSIQLTQLNAIAVSKGPGSYTGLRIGVSAAKGLCFSLNIPLISISTLESLSYQVKCKEGVIVPMLDARRMEVYSAVFDFKHDQVREIQAQILDEQSFRGYLEKGLVYFVGNGVEKTEMLIKHSNAIFVKNKLPSANEMGMLAYKKFKTNSFEDVAYFEPYYLKDFVVLTKKKV